MAIETEEITTQEVVPDKQKKEDNYVSDLYKWVSSMDKTFSERYSPEEFEANLQKRDYAEKMHGWISSMDETFSERRPFEQFVETVKKKDEPGVFPTKDEEKVITSDSEEGKEEAGPSDVSALTEDKNVVKTEEVTEEDPVVEEKVAEEDLSEEKAIIQKEEDEAVVELRKKYGKLGFEFEEIGIGDAIKIKSFPDDSPIPIVHEIEIDLQPFWNEEAEARKLKTFIEKHAVDKSAKELKELEEEGLVKESKITKDDILAWKKDFYEKNNLDYDVITKAEKDIIDIEGQIEEIRKNPEGKEIKNISYDPKFPDYKEVATLSKEQEKKIATLEGEAEKIYTATPEIEEGIYADVKFKTDQKLAKAERVYREIAINDNNNLKEQADILNQESRNAFGVPVKDLSQQRFTTQEQVDTANNLILKAIELNEAAQIAADNYKVSAFYFDAKTNKQIGDKFVDQYTGFFNNLEKGFVTGQASVDVIMAETGTSTLEDATESIALKEAQIRSLYDSEAMAKYNSAKTIEEKLALISNDPIEIIGSLAGNTMAMMMPIGAVVVPTTMITGGLIGGAVAGLPGAAVGLTKGMATGMGLVSFAMEYTNTILDTMRKNNLDLTNGQDIIKGFTDDVLMSEAREKGAKRGAIIGVFDAVTANIAGRLITPFQTIAKRRALMAGEALVAQPIFEGTGEGLAQLATEGKLNSLEVMDEMVGSKGFGATSLAVNVYTKTSKGAQIKLANEMASLNNVLHRKQDEQTINQWADRMKAIGYIDEATTKKIKENANIKEEATNIATKLELQGKEKSEVKTAVAELIQEKKRLSIFPDAYKEDITEIDNAINEIIRNKGITEESQAVLDKFKEEPVVKEEAPVAEEAEVKEAVEEAPAEEVAEAEAEVVEETPTEEVVEEVKEEVVTPEVKEEAVEEVVEDVAEDAGDVAAEYRKAKEDFLKDNPDTPQSVIDVMDNMIRSAEELDAKTKEAPIEEQAEPYEQWLEGYKERTGQFLKDNPDLGQGAKDAISNMMDQAEALQEKASKDRVMEEVGGIIEKVKERNPNLTDKALKEMQAEQAIAYLQNPKNLWYQQATDTQRDAAVREVKKMLKIPAKAAPSISKLFNIAADKVIEVTDKQLRKWMEKDLLKGFKIGEKKGVKETKAQQREAAKIKKALKDELSKELNAILKEGKGKLTIPQVRAILNKFDKMNILNETKREAFIDYVQEALAKSKEKVRQSLIQDIIKLVNKKAKTARTQSGKRRGKGLDSEGQLFFAQVKEILTLAKNNDTDGMIKVMDSLTDDAAIAATGLSVDQLIAKEIKGEELNLKEEKFLSKLMAFDMFADVLNMPVDKVEKMLAALKDVRAESIKRLAENRKKRAEKYIKAEKEATTQIQGDYEILFNEDGTLKNEDEIQETWDTISDNFKKLKLWSWAKGQWSKFDFSNLNLVRNFFQNILQHLETVTKMIDKSEYHPKQAFFKKEIYDKLNDKNEDTLRGQQEQKSNLDSIANTIEGITKGYKQIKEKLRGAPVRIMLANGKEVLYNKDNLLRIYALSKNKIQRDKLYSQGFSKSVMKAIEKRLGIEATQFADKIIEYLSNEYFDTVNKVYKEVNDVNLNFIENYFPTKTMTEKVNSEELGNGEFNKIFNAETAPALKERLDVKGKVKTKGENFTTVLEKHLDSMEKYKAYAVAVQEINALFRIPAVNTLLQTLGVKSLMRNSINYAISPEYGIDVKTESRIINWLMTRFTEMTLGFKTIQIAKQATSFVNAYEEYQATNKGPLPGVDLTMFALDTAWVALTLPVQIKKAYKMSATFRDRIKQGLKGDVWGLESGASSFKPISHSSSFWAKAWRAFKTGSASPTILGDILGVMGYMASYNANIRRGMSKEDAMKAFNNYNATQQTRRGTEKAPLQQSRSIYKRAFTMFGSSLILMINRTLQNLMGIMRHTRKGRIHKIVIGREARGLAINFAITNVLFAAVSNIALLIDGDDEDREEFFDRIKDAFFGLNLIYQVPFMGAAVEEMMNRINGKKPWGTSILNPFMEVGKKIVRATEKGEYGKVGQKLLDLIIGTNTDPVVGMYEYFKDDKVNEEDLYQMLGMTPYYLPARYAKEKKKREKKKKKSTSTIEPNTQSATSPNP